MGSTLGSLWIMLESLSDNVGMKGPYQYVMVVLGSLGSPRGHHVITLGSLCDHVGWLWDQFRITMGSILDHVAVTT